LREQHDMTLKIAFPPLLQRLAGLYGSMGDVKKGYEYDHRARLIHEQAGRSGTMGWSAAMHNEVLSLMNLGEWRAAFDAESIVIRSHLGQDPDSIPAGISIVYANLLTNIGRAEEALPWLDHAQKAALASGDVSRVVSMRAARAKAFLALHRLDDAEAELRSISELAHDQSAQVRIQSDRATIFRAELLIQRGELKAARDAIAPLLIRARDPQNGLAGVFDDALLISARIDATNGHLVEAAAQAGEALEINQSRARDATQSADVGSAAFQLAKIKSQLGDSGAARELADRAVVAFTNAAGPEHALTQDALKLQASLH
jgi:tetratricopeptide (TPR) repeat protein